MGQDRIPLAEYIPADCAEDGLPGGMEARVRKRDSPPVTAPHPAPRGPQASTSPRPATRNGRPHPLLRRPPPPHLGHGIGFADPLFAVTPAEADLDEDH